MQKIPTMYYRDESKPGHPVKDEIRPECQWVLDGEGNATIKLDGTNVKILGGALYKRQKPKDRDYDEASYVLCDRTKPEDRWAWEAFDAGHGGDGIYELIGPKVQGNPYRLTIHKLVSVVPPDESLIVLAEMHLQRNYAGLRSYLLVVEVEGLVFHHPDGKMAKIKRRDFGLRWPV